LTNKTESLRKKRQPLMSLTPLFSLFWSHYIKYTLK
jgi:hypothetical protein